MLTAEAGQSWNVELEAMAVINAQSHPASPGDVKQDVYWSENFQLIFTKQDIISSANVSGETVQCPVSPLDIIETETPGLHTAETSSAMLGGHNYQLDLNDWDLPLIN